MADELLAGKAKLRKTETAVWQKTRPRLPVDPFIEAMQKRMGIIRKAVGRDDDEDIDDDDDDEWDDDDDDDEW